MVDDDGLDVVQLVRPPPVAPLSIPLWTSPEPARGFHLEHQAEKYAEEAEELCKHPHVTAVSKEVCAPLVSLRSCAQYRVL